MTKLTISTVRYYRYVQRETLWQLYLNHCKIKFNTLPRKTQPQKTI